MLTIQFSELFQARHSLSRVDTKEVETNSVHLHLQTLLGHDDLSVAVNFKLSHFNVTLYFQVPNKSSD